MISEIMGGLGLSGVAIIPAYATPTAVKLSFRDLQMAIQFCYQRVQLSSLHHKNISHFTKYFSIDTGCVRLNINTRWSKQIITVQEKGLYHRRGCMLLTSSSNSLQIPQKYLAMHTPQLMQNCRTWNNRGTRKKISVE